MSTKPAQVKGSRGTLRGYVEYLDRAKPKPKHNGHPHTKCAGCARPMAPSFQYRWCTTCRIDKARTAKAARLKRDEGRIEVARAILAVAARKKELGIRR